MSHLWSYLFCQQIQKVKSKPLQIQKANSKRPPLLAVECVSGLSVLWALNIGCGVKVVSERTSISGQGSLVQLRWEWIC